MTRIVTPGVNDLASQNPELAAQWHPTKNGDLTPEMIMPGSNKKVWWICDTDPRHEWDAVCAKRNNGQGCPICVGLKVVTGVNDLATLSPEIAAQWHTYLNGDKIPEIVAIHSNKKAWWSCGEEGHEWETSIANRTRGNGCPFCSGKKVLAGYNDLATTHPNIAAMWHPSLNKGATPEMVTQGSHKKFWWVCSEPGHIWEASVANLTLGRGCALCAGKKVIPGVNDLASQNPKIAAQWHPTLNKGATPEMVTQGSHKKFWWVCSEPGHIWEASVANRSRGSGCPICAGLKFVPGINDLATVRPEIAAQWHSTKNGNLLPSEVLAGTNQKAWWVCPEGHEWEATLYSRMQGAGCHVCWGHLIITGVNDLATLRPEIAAQWHPIKNGDALPEATAISSAQKVWWVCSNGHEWLSRISHRTSGSGCPTCFSESTTSKAEKEVSDLIETLLGKEQYVARNVRTEEGVTEIDIHIPSRQLAVEFNGIYWHSVSPSGEPEYSRIHKNYHSDKSQACKARGISLIHIWEDDYTNRRDLVIRTLARALDTEDTLIKPGVLTEPNTAYTEKLDAENLEFTPLDDDYAAEFMTENSLKRHHADEAVGEYYGLTDANGDVRAAISVVETGSMFAPELLVTGFATLGIVPGALDTLITNLSERYGVKKFAFIVDPSSDDIRAIRAAGFVDTGEREEPTLYACTNEKRYHPEDETNPANAVRKLWDEGREIWAVSGPGN